MAGFVSVLKLLLRDQWHHRLTLFTSISVLALGAAMVSGVDHSIKATQQAFLSAWHAVHGDSSHRIVSRDGGTFDEQVYLDLVRGGTPAAIARLTPMLVDTVPVYRSQSDSVQATFMGFDPITFLNRPPDSAGTQRRGESSVESSLLEGLSEQNLRALLTRPGYVLISAGLLKKLGIDAAHAVGARLRLVRNSGAESVLVIAGVSALDRGSDLLLGDIATAQEVLGRIGELSEIQMVASESRSEYESPFWYHSARWLAAVFPGLSVPVGVDSVPRIEMLLDAHLQQRAGRSLTQDLQVESLDEQRFASSRLADSFFLNLGALSLLSLVVAAFLVRQAAQFMVLRRGLVLQRLRALGVTRMELGTGLLVEGLLLAVIAAVAGASLGLALSSALVASVGASSGELFFSAAPPEVIADPVLLMKGSALCVVAALFISAHSFYAILKSPSKHGTLMAYEKSSRRWLIGLRAHADLVFSALVAVALLSLPTGGVGAIGAIAALLWFSGRLLILSIPMYLRGLAYLCRNSALLGLVVADMLRHFHEARGAAVALLLAISATLGMLIMVESFRLTFDQWLQQRIGARLYLSIAQASSQTAQTEALEDLFADLRSLPGITSVQARGFTSLVHKQRSISVGHLRFDAALERRYHLAAGTLQAGNPLARQVLVSEPLARAWHVSVGDELDLAPWVDAGPWSVAGVFREYGGRPDRLLFDSRVLHARWRGAEAALRVRVIEVQGAAEQLAKLQTTMEESLQRGQGDGLGLGIISAVQSGVAIQRVAADVFARTFAVADVIRLLALLVAVAGMGAAFCSLQLARRFDLGVLRALGFSRAQLIALMVMQGCGFGFVVAVSSLVPGALVALLLVEVLNPRAFGWSLDFFVPWASVLSTMALSVAAAAAAGAVAAWVSARQPPSQLLRAGVLAP